MLEAYNDVLGVTHDDDLTSGIALSPPVCPEIEDVMEIDIGQQWRGNLLLGRACPLTPSPLSSIERDWRFTLSQWYPGMQATPELEAALASDFFWVSR